MDLREVGWDGMDWIDLVQDTDQERALVNMVMNLRVPQIAEKFLSSCTIGGFSRRAQLHEWSDVMVDIRIRKLLQECGYPRSPSRRKI
jgi:hypothetical protein